MRSDDYVPAGGGFTVTIPTGIMATGFRIIPVLAASATPADMVAAYALITNVAMKKGTQNFPTGVTENMLLSGPDWIRSPGLGEIIVTVAAGTYRVWIATDCKEMMDAVPPFMNGFPSSGTSTGGTNTTTATTKNFTGTAPSAAGDGVDITNAKAVKVSYKAATAAATLNAVGSVKVYGYSTGASRWVRMPDLDYVPTEAVVEPMAFGPQPYSIPFGVGRVCFVPSALTASAGTQVNEVVEVLT